VILASGDMAVFAISLPRHIVRIVVTKMTILAWLMRLTGLKGKTQTVEFALRETKRKSRLAKFLGTKKIAASEWKGSIDPAYDLAGLRVAEKPDLT
jgi:hypothetical protein